MKIISITNPYSLKHEVNIINELFAQGLNKLHLRKPDFEKQEMINFIESIDPQYHNRLVLHQFYSLTKIFDINSIHVPYEDLKSRISSFIINTFAISHDKEIKKSTTFSHYKSLYGNAGGAEDIILGPIYTKAADDIFNPCMNLENLSIALKKTDKIVYALGGVSSSNVAEMENLGFGGIVLQSAIWKTIDPVSEFMKINTSFQNTEIKPVRLFVSR